MIRRISPRVLAALAVTASTLAACNALLSLDDEYRLASDAGDATSDVGTVDVVTPDTGVEASIDAGCWANPKIVMGKAMSDQPDWPVPNAARIPLVSNPASYDASVPGEVYDNITRLTWLIDVDAAARPVGTYPEVNSACAGRGGARLPTRMELVSIQATYNDLDASTGTDPQYFPDTDPSYYWSSTQGAAIQTFRWSVNFDLAGFGFVDSQDTTSSLFGRCVRGPAPSGAPLPAHRYEVSEACGIVRDVRTRLEWERAKGVQKKYSLAELHCEEDLPNFGGNAWRLPTYAELASIVLTTRADPTIDLDAFEASSSNYWTSTKPFRFENNRIIVSFFDGNGLDVRNVDKPEMWGRCVRTMD